jgi:hypothetical protein
MMRYAVRAVTGGRVPEYWERRDTVDAVCFLLAHRVSRNRLLTSAYLNEVWEHERKRFGYARTARSPFRDREWKEYPSMCAGIFVLGKLFPLYESEWSDGGIWPGVWPKQKHRLCWDKAFIECVSDGRAYSLFAQCCIGRNASATGVSGGAAVGECRTCRKIREDRENYLHNKRLIDWINREAREHEY